jgi:hypothetical protein
LIALLRGANTGVKDMGKYTKLIEAAKKIEELSVKQEQRTKAWQELARDARNPNIDRKEIDCRKSELDASRVIDFGNAIAELRHALKAI